MDQVVFELTLRRLLVGGVDMTLLVLMVFVGWNFLPWTGLLMLIAVFTLGVMVMSSKRQARERVVLLRLSEGLPLRPSDWSYFERHAFFFTVPGVANAIASVSGRLVVGSIVIAVVFGGAGRWLEVAVAAAIALVSLSHVNLNHPFLAAARAAQSEMQGRFVLEQADRDHYDAIVNALHGGRAGISRWS